MGTLLRTAAWYGINNVFCSRNSVDIYNPKVVRSSMGAHFHIGNLLQVNIMDIITQIRSNGGKLITATLDGLSHKNFNLSHDDWALVLGSEAYGIRDEIIQISDESICIPPLGNIESLNVAVAGSIILDQLID